MEGVNVCRERRGSGAVGGVQLPSLREPNEERAIVVRRIQFSTDIGTKVW